MALSKRIIMNCPECHDSIVIKINSVSHLKTCPNCKKQFDIVALRLEGKLKPEDIYTIPVKIGKDYDQRKLREQFEKTIKKHGLE